MEARFENKNGEPVHSATKLLKHIQASLDARMHQWSKELREHPEDFGSLEVKIHQAFAGLADKAIATVLVEATEVSEALEQSKKK